MTSPDPERLRNVNALLEVALSLAEAERAAWLQALPAEQQALVPMLRSLLDRAAVETGSFMQRPLGVRLGDLDDLEAVIDRPGDSVGPYRLLRELGAGGMATVWLAERADGVLQRQVALKLPRTGWALGLARRMAHERDILASLEHPRIARLYDAGTTAAGRPWLAMEYVGGSPIDAFCRERRLGVAPRLRLFLQVADAVAHAHARLVVHRDLKPANVLVTPEGAVRLLDFGVAKLLQDDDAPDSDLTQRLGRAATPDYASPEQVAGQPVTVATDVYSLGVLLYELLSGVRPYHVERPSAAALEEAILTADVAKASERVHGDAVLARQLRGDIDTILAKALRKNPAQRYASVESFAADVQRHLDGEPVLAQPPSRRYRALKFVRRHRAWLAAGGAVALSLCAGLGVALWQAQSARAEAARAEQVKRFIASIFKEAAPREGVGGRVTAGDLLAAAAARIETELAAAPAVAAELGVMIGESFSMLGEPARGEQPLRAAIARAEQVYGPRHPLTVRGKGQLIGSLNVSDLDTTERLLSELLPDARAGLPATADLVVPLLREQSFLLAKRNQADASYAALHEAVRIGERHLGAAAPETLEALGLLANTYGRFGDNTRQLAVATDALQRAQSAFGASRPHNLLTAVERWYGEALRANQRPADALPVLRRVLQDQRALDGADTPRVRNAMLQLGVALDAAGRQRESLPMLRQASALEAAQNTADSDDRVAFGVHLARALAGVRRADEALALLDRTEVVEKTLDASPSSARVGQALLRARLLALRGDDAAAARAVAAAAAAAEGAGPRSASRRAEARLVAAFNARLQGRTAEAVALAQPVVAAVDAGAVAPAVAAAAAAELGTAWLDRGDFARGEQALLQSKALFTAAQVEPSPRMADTLVGLARVHLHAGRAAPAQALLQPLVAAWAELHPGSEWHGQALHWLARAEAMQGQADAARGHQRAAAAMLAASRLPALRRLATGGAT